MKTSTLILSLCAPLILFAGCATTASAPAGPAPTGGVTLRDFKLTGDLSGNTAAFTLTAIAKVDDSKGGSLDLLSGTVGLTQLGPHPNWKIRAEQNRYVITFDRRGEFPIQVKFDAAVRQSDGWNVVEFRVAPSTLQPIVLQGLGADTQFQFAGAARPERKANEFVSYLPSGGFVGLSWKEARPETEGKLFYAAEMLSQISVSPGLMRQSALLNFKVMQGELNRVTLLLRGAGEVTGVQGDHVLRWSVEPGSDGNSANRRLEIQLNQPQKDQFVLLVQMQTTLGAFPQTQDAMQLRPDDATRFSGYVRIVNEGAVRLEVAQATGMSQVSPEQFPESDVTRAVLRPTGSQRFAYRFSGADFGLRIQADQILPEIAVSEVLAYHHGENELTISAEIELDIREAPLRELLLRVPKNYAVVQPAATGLTDYFLAEPENRPDAELRLVYGQPVSGRQVIQLRLERNHALGQTNWTLPRIEVVQAKSVRGFVSVSSDAGFRLTPERTQSLTDIATAFFPRKVAGIQTAFRLNEPTWQATVRVERLPQTVQADVLHLFSIGEGIAYGSSVMNYVVSGAPVSAFRVELSQEYFNVEFTGKDIRSWQTNDGAYVVQLHTPVTGPYTLLATYERPFKAQGDTLAFTGARPLDAQSEQGHTLIISANQFQVNAVDVSSTLLPLETGEVPAEYRLFFDAPILKAYRYVSRPFNLKLALSPLQQGDSIHQVVDRASLKTRISKEGQVLTEARYFVKSRGEPEFRVTLPDGMQLWSVTVNQMPVVPVTDGKSNLIPLPQHLAPDAVLDVEMKLAQTNDASRVSVAAPKVDAPVTLAEWQLAPDAGQRLIYRSGTLAPAGGTPDISGFAGLARLFKGEEAGKARSSLLMALVLVGAALLVWRWATQTNARSNGARQLAGIVLGLIAFGFAIASFAQLAALARDESRSLPDNVTVVAPVQQANSELAIEVSNVPAGTTVFDFLLHAWPTLLAVVVWIYGWRNDDSLVKGTLRVLGWTLLAWAVLRMPNGAPAFFWVVVAFLFVHVVFPALRQLWRLMRRSDTGPSTEAGGASPAVTALLLGGLLSWCVADAPSARAAAPATAGVPTPESVVQDIRVEDKFALATAKIRWQATKGDILPLPQEPAVLTRLSYPNRSVRLVASQDSTPSNRRLVADESGVFEVEIQYQLQITKNAAESSLTLPVRAGLINRLNLTVVNADVDVLSPSAVAVHRELAGSNTVAKLTLSPANGARIVWRPPTRDVKHEKPVFHADLVQLYVPAAGVIEGAYFASISPDHGELSELIFTVPEGATVTDVLDATSPQGANRPSLVSLWRFDPDTRKLRVAISPAQSRPFALVIRSQKPTGGLPFEQSMGLLSVENAATQNGWLGLATGNEVQIDDVNARQFAPINLEDFPAAAGLFPPGSSGVVVRRAFRYSGPGIVEGGGGFGGGGSGWGRVVPRTFSVKVSAVEPDVRVETQDTLSLGEDRTVLAANLTANITRAGVFRLSFAMPAGFDVESISGPTLSHWTESKSGAERIITLHLPGKTQGVQQFAVSLSGPGMKATNGWTVPQLVLREASKQRGTLLVVPEQGMRLQVGTREGVTQLDPQKSGIRQKGVLAFHILQVPSNLTLDVEQVDPWIQVASFQHATISEAQMKIVANLQYQIENTGLKTFHVFLPTNAQSVRVQGEQVAGSVPGAITNGLQQWEITLHRRIIGSYLLQISYQTALPAQASEAVLRGIEAGDVNLQRGFVAVQSDARLQVRVDAPPSALQPAEWQSIPRGLLQDLPAAAANFAFRLVEPSFQLPLKLERHEAARLLPARVESVTFNSVISDDGVMLTQARLDILPGDKRLLNLTLPPDTHFWFAFVNQNGVWPWREKENVLLIPLEQQSRDGKPIVVEIFYSGQAGNARSHELDLQLLAPKFDLPLENVTWRVSLSDKWRVRRWGGALQLQQEEMAPPAIAIDVTSYLQNEESLQQAKTRAAEDFMAMANSALEQGDPQQARRAFQAAYGLSTHDAAFNEDARVQLHNIKLQQALVGLNVRQSEVTGNPGAIAGRLRDRNRKELNYTQQDAKDLIDRNTADDNAAFVRLAERIIQQQDAAVNSPSALRATIPEQGRVLTFRRAVVVDRWADLRINVEAETRRTASWGLRLLVLGGTVLLLLLLTWVGRTAKTTA